MERSTHRGGVWLLLVLLVGLLAFVASLRRGGRPAGPALPAEPVPVADPDLYAFEASLGEAGEADEETGSREPLRQEVPAPTAAGALQDDEWRSFPITTFSFAKALLFSPGPLQARWLFRNRQLNPRDAYLAPGVRDEMRAAFESGRTVVVRLSEELARTASDEFGMLIDARVLQPARYEDYVQRLDPEARSEHDRLVAQAVEKARRDGTFNGLGPEEIEREIREIQVLDPRLAHGYRPFQTRRIGSDYYACRLADLPGTCVSARVYREAYLAAIADLARIVCEAGALDEAQRQAVEKAGSKAVDEKYAP